jgi:hypothetical protein
MHEKISKTWQVNVDFMEPPILWGIVELDFLVT